VLDHRLAAGGRGRVRKEPGNSLRKQAHAVVVRTKNGLLSEHTHAAPERNSVPTGVRPPPSRRKDHFGSPVYARTSSPRCTNAGVHIHARDCQVVGP